MRFLIIALVLLIQACGSLWAQTPVPGQPDSPGFLHSLMERARAAKAKVQNAGEVVLGYMGAYYEDHVQPVADSYSEWASGIQDSLREKIQSYMPFMAMNMTDA
ncbi:apolipoprotein C-IV [Dunckerocampus dactyliophorus]|uniref:apolipoprotein C-IV n=1 Tax=Dunckerocampus dactyliophorus TaxID=161453 RepID=UPI002405DA60|nr:apolipoprotein C-IV [Dunckerocampus dactyliophorus]